MTQTPPDLSAVSLFLNADPVVQGVMLLLGGASVAAWAIALDRGVRIHRLRREARRLDTAARNQSAPDLATGLADNVLKAGEAAAALKLEGESRGERRERLREAMRLTLADALAAVQPGLPFLATIGSAAPFIGLFGTVWGIMHAFTGIAESGDTSLAAVAPGIAEALAATAIGLAAAIPAVLAYNRLAAGLGAARQMALAAIARFSDRLSAEAPATLRPGARPAPHLAAAE
jgi:biopolymer transport protein TolQ